MIVYNTQSLRFHGLFPSFEIFLVISNSGRWSDSGNPVILRASLVIVCENIVS
jgi:hypothetical protein